jgi:hypothetical protein
MLAIAIGGAEPFAIAIILENSLVRWAIVMLPHRDLAVGKVLNRDGSL